MEEIRLAFPEPKKRWIVLRKLGNEWITSLDYYKDKKSAKDWASKFSIKAQVIEVVL